MSSQIYNNTFDTLASAIDNVQTSFDVTSGDIPVLDAGDYIPIHVIRASDNAFEIMHVTGVSGTTLNVDRAAETPGDNPLTFNSGDRVEIRPTRQALAEMDSSSNEVSTSSGEQLLSDALDDRVIHVDTVSERDALTGLVTGQQVSVSGGIFAWNGSSFEQRTSVPIQAFGVVGDGVADDTLAMADVAAFAGDVHGHQSLSILTDLVTVSASLRLDMLGGKLILKTASQRLLTIDSNNVEIRNAEFDGNGLTTSGSLILVNLNRIGYLFDGCLIRNITGTSPGTDQYGIKITFDNTRGRIHNCRFEDISNQSDGTPLSAFCGGVVLVGDPGAPAEDLRITDCTAKNIFSTNIAGDINNSDADGLRIVSLTGTWNCNIHITNFTAIDVQKSGIKTSGCKGLVVDGVKVYNDRSDISMIAGVRFQAADESVISNINLIGRMIRGINIRSSRIVVDNVQFSPIDTTRDTCSNGLVALQSSAQNGSTQISVSNVVGTNIDRPIVVTPDTGLSAYPFRDLSFSNINVRGIGVAGALGSIIRFVKGCTFNDVYFLDPNESWNTALDIDSCADVSIVGGRMEAKRNIITVSEGSGATEDVSIKGTVFFRPDSQSTVADHAMLDIRGASGAQLDRVRLDGITLSMPGYTSSSNQDAIRCNLNDSVVIGVKMDIRGPDTKPPNFFIRAEAVNSSIFNVSVDSDVGLAIDAGVSYAVTLLTGSVKNLVSDIRSIARGVNANTGADNNMITDVAAQLNGITDNGTGNTIGLAKVFS